MGLGGLGAEGGDSAAECVEPGEQFGVAFFGDGRVEGLEVERAVGLEFATMHFVDVFESLAMEDFDEFLAGHSLALKRLLSTWPLRMRTAARPSSRRVRRGERKSMRTTSQLMASRVMAPMTPPVTELSSPMMAFCTVLERESRTTRSKGLSWASSRLPKIAAAAPAQCRRSRDGPASRGGEAASGTCGRGSGNAAWKRG